MRKRSNWPGLLAAAPLVMQPVQTVIAADYVSVEAAQRSAFNDADHFAQVALRLSPQQRQMIDQLAGPQPRRGNLQIWQAQRAGAPLGYFFVDEVLGRQDLITYAVGIDNKGILSTLEVLSYRESHGGEIRNHNWRAQFAQRASLEQMRFRTDIKNIAGATLSCEHVTQGVRWLMALWQTALRQAESTS
jgi:Na+-translocating ferredoxin:NAD+ oxidoreductase RnfG subunit